MKKALFTLAILVMAFGNMSFAQSKAELRAKTTERIFKQYGLTRDSYYVPEVANFYEVDGTQHRTTYYYDESDYTLTTELTETYYDSWTNESRISYDYDFNGNVFEVLVETWDNGDWQNEMRASYSYNGDVISEIVCQSFMDGSWVNTLKEVYNFNGDQWTVLYWLWNGNTWTSFELYTYTRVSNVIELLIQYMEGGAWQNEMEEIYTLDFDENVTEILYRTWDPEDVLWIDYEKMTYVYEGGVYTDQYQQSWDGAEWYDEYHYTYEYDADGNAKHGMCYGFGGYDWAPDDGDIEMAYGYNAETKSFYGSEVNMVYVDLTNVKENAQANFKVYPVPAENELFIQAEDFQKAEIFSLRSEADGKHDGIDERQCVESRRLPAEGL